MSYQYNQVQDYMDTISPVKTAKPQYKETQKQIQSNRKFRWYDIFLFSCCNNIDQGSINERYSQSMKRQRSGSMRNHLPMMVRADSQNISQNSNYYEQYSGTIKIQYHHQSQNQGVPVIFELNQKVVIHNQELLMLEGTQDHSLIYYQITNDPSTILLDTFKNDHFKHQFMIGIKPLDLISEYVSPLSNNKEIFGINPYTSQQKYQPQISAEGSNYDIFIVDDAFRFKSKKIFDLIIVEPFLDSDKLQVLEQSTGRLQTNILNQMVKYLNQLMAWESSKIKILIPAYVNITDVIDIFQQIQSQKVLNNRFCRIYEILPNITGIFDKNDQFICHSITFKASQSLITAIVQERIFSEMSPNVTEKEVNQLCLNTSAKTILQCLYQVEHLTSNRQIRWIQIIKDSFGWEFTLKQSSSSGKILLPINDIYSINHQIKDKSSKTNKTDMISASPLKTSIQESSEFTFAQFESFPQKNQQHTTNSRLGSQQSPTSMKPPSLFNEMYPKLVKETTSQDSQHSFEVITNWKLRNSVN